MKSVTLRVATSSRVLAELLTDSTGVTILMGPERVHYDRAEAVAFAQAILGQVRVSAVMDVEERREARRAARSRRR